MVFWQGFWIVPRFPVVEGEYRVAVTEDVSLGKKGVHFFVWVRGPGGGHLPGL